jgi:hypothetical protein
MLHVPRNRAPTLGLNLCIFCTGSFRRQLALFEYVPEVFGEHGTLALEKKNAGDAHLASD